MTVLCLFIITYGVLDRLEENSMNKFLKKTYSDVPEVILNESFDMFKSDKLGESGFIEVYENGKLIYPNGNGRLTLDEIALLPDESKRPIITTEYYEDFFGQEHQEITFEYYNNLEKADMDILVINEDHSVIYTTLDINRELSKRQIQLLTGVLDNEFEISKCSFISSSNRDLIIVYYREYSPFNRETNSLEGIKGCLAIAFVVIFLLSSIIYLIILDKHVNKPVTLLTHAITDVALDFDKVIHYKGPREFEHVCRSFNDMQERLSYEIQKRNEAKSEKTKILSDISHDLKTPITVISGFAIALMENKIPEHEKQNVYKRIRKRSDYLNELINEFNEYNRLERKDMIANLKNIDISQFSRQYFIDRYDEITMQDYRLEIDIEDNLEVKIDFFLMIRVYENILSNIIKYTPKKTKISFKLKKEINSVIIMYGDDGPGIENNIKENIFKPFVVGEEVRNNSSGSGLGMAIVHRIIDLHDGRIELLSEKGTKYKITLSYLQTIKAYSN